MAPINMKIERAAWTKKQQGIGLIELLLSISIIAVIIIGAIALYSSVSESNKVEKMVKNHLVMTTAIRSIFAQSSSYTGLEEGIATSGVFPESMVSGGYLTTPFGGTIWPSPLGTTAKKFSLLYLIEGDPLPMTIGACVQFVSRLLSSEATIRMPAGVAVTTVDGALGKCRTGYNSGSLVIRIEEK